MKSKIFERDDLKLIGDGYRKRGHTVVFTNGCFDILHVGHIELLEKARSLGDFLVVGINSDASVKRLKGESRPINDQNARAKVLAALECVHIVVIFEEDTPIETIQMLRPNVHVKGGDYAPDDLPETAIVRQNGGEIVIVPLVDGFSTTKAIEKSAVRKPQSAIESWAIIVIPARFGSTRFPGKPLVELGGQTVISRVVRAALQSSASKPILVATDDARIASEIESQFSSEEAVAEMTSPECRTGTDRLAELIHHRFWPTKGRLLVVNVQGDEPFIEPKHIDALIDVMNLDPMLQMATLATPILDSALESDPNVVKVVVSEKGRALYFSRAAIPFDRDGEGVQRLRHLGIYAYDARWLIEMARLPPSKLEEIEKLEQLRALEHGISIGVAVVEDVVPIAIDTPEDLVRAQAWLAREV